MEKMEETLEEYQYIKILESGRRFMETMNKYRCAIMEVETKLNVLNAEFSLQYDRNPFESIKSRLKSPRSIIEKLHRRGIPFSQETVEELVEENLYDVAGIRVVCAFQEDIYRLADLLLRQDDIHLIRTKDYIKHPKPNGYRSLHLILEIPVFLEKGKTPVKVEVQFRTIAMDFWASLEHQMKYKQNIPEQEAIVEQLRLCAQRVSELDEEMMSIRSRIEAAKDNPSQDDVLLERLTHLEAPLD